MRAAGCRSEVEPFGFGAVERPGAATAEDLQLVAGLVYRAVAVDAFGNSERGAMSVGGGN